MRNPTALPTILLIEENPADTYWTEIIQLDNAPPSFTLIHADGLEMGFRLLAAGDVQVILLGLPSDGQGLSKFNQLSRQVPHMPILVLSRHYDEHLAARVMEGGAQEFLVKGQIDGPLLRRMIRYAVERKTVEESLREKAAELETIVSSMGIFLGKGSIRDASRELLHGAVTQTSSGYGFIGLKVEGPALRILAQEGTVSEAQGEPAGDTQALEECDGQDAFEFSELNSLFRRVIVSGEPVLSNSPQSDLCSRGTSKHPPLNRCLGVPIMSGTDVIGMIGVANRGQEYTSIQRSQLDILSRAASILYDSYRRREREAMLQLEQKQTDAKLRAAQSRLTHVLEANPAVIYSLAVNGGSIKPAWISANIAAMTGYLASEALNEGWWESHIHPDDKEAVLGQIPLLLTLGFQNREYRIRHKSGSYVWVHDARKLLRDTSGQPIEVVGSWSDISERKQVEEQLRQAQKLEAVGKLTGGIAHDFNNLLMVILGHCQMVIDRLQPTGEARAELEAIHTAGNRAAQLTRQLLAFSRRQILQAKVLDLNTVVTNLEPMLQRLIGEDIAITTGLASALGSVKADQGQIEQVIMNLVINSRDAMPQGGKIHIETSNVLLDEAYARQLMTVQPGPYVMLAVSDTGTGMSAEVQAHIFDPFFTTKTDGTGLGLSTVYGIVKQSGGAIYVYSEMDRGSTFKVYLPQVDAIVQPVRLEEAGVKFPRGSETTLLVEDEIGVRKLARAVLQSCGYRVLDAVSGLDALQICEEPVGSLNILVTDVVMPGMSGRELAQQLRLKFLDMRVLYMSGYTEDTILRHGVLMEENAFLQKPFSLDTLAEKVRATLDAAHSKESTEMDAD